MRISGESKTRLSIGVRFWLSSSEPDQEDDFRDRWICDQIPSYPLHHHSLILPRKKFGYRQNMDIEKFMRGKRPTWAEVNLDHLESNFRMVKEILGRDVKVMAVVKADAYGHGALPVAQRLERCGVNSLAVAVLEEALELRKMGIRCSILLFNGFWSGQEEEIVHNNLTPAVFSLRMVQDLAQVANRLKTKATYHFKIDTGMSRLGVDWTKAVETVENSSSEQSVICEGIYTHLSSAEIAGSPSNRIQIERFQNIVKSLELKNFPLKWRHVANSAGILNLRYGWFDGVRPGLVLYGISPLEQAVEMPLQPVLSFKTRIMQLRRVHKGTSIGYGGAYKTDQESLIATLPVGYADGLSRLLSNKGSVLIRGHKAAIVGRISMDLTLINVTHVPSVQVGDEVVLIGKQGTLEVVANDLARLTLTIPYEILCGISRRVPRIYVGA